MNLPGARDTTRKQARRQGSQLRMEPYLWWRALVKTRFALLIFG
jgi:hypothetical protein